MDLTLKRSESAWSHEPQSDDIATIEESRRVNSNYVILLYAFHGEGTSSDLAFCFIVKFVASSFIGAHPTIILFMLAFRCSFCLERCHRVHM